MLLRCRTPLKVTRVVPCQTIKILTDSCSHPILKDGLRVYYLKHKWLIFPSAGVQNSKAVAREPTEEPKRQLATLVSKLNRLEQDLRHTPFVFKCCRVGLQDKWRTEKPQVVGSARLFKPMPSTCKASLFRRK